MKSIPLIEVALVILAGIIGYGGYVVLNAFDNMARIAREDEAERHFMERGWDREAERIGSDQANQRRDVLVNAFRESGQDH